MVGDADTDLHTNLADSSAGDLVADEVGDNLDGGVGDVDAVVDVLGNVDVAATDAVASV